MSKKYKFEEILAKNILLDMTKGRYSRLELDDKPDLYDPIQNVGIEISQTAFQMNMRREKEFRHLLCQCKGDDDIKTINNLRHILSERYDSHKQIELVTALLSIEWDYRFNTRESRDSYIKELIEKADFWTLWSLQCLFDHNTEGVFPAIDNKVNKLSRYKKFTTYDLFLFSDELFTFERLNDLSNGVYDTCTDVFRFLYLDASSSTSMFSEHLQIGHCLVIFDIITKSFEQIFYEKQARDTLFDRTEYEFELLVKDSD